MNLKINVTLLSFISLTGIFLGSCGQTFNSNTSDNLLLPSNYCQDQSDTALCEANEVIQTKCTTCHTSGNYHSAWGAYDTNAEWLAAGGGTLVIGANPEASKLVSKLKVWGTSGNMPEGAAALTEEEYNKIKSWINAL
jgi:uncharacterized membrane protein